MKLEELAPSQHTSFNAVFLAMAHWHLGKLDEARKWYDRAVECLEKNEPQDEDQALVELAFGPLDDALLTNLALSQIG